jgi:hypothetical protein
MDLFNKERYINHYNHRKAGSGTEVSELLLTILLFGSIGAITWAIRGTAGWGGVDGTVVPGLMWGILWYYLAFRKGIDARGIVLWLGMGLALGGELGYGQYVGWIQGNFNVGDEIIAIKPWLGYFWFMMCGIGWAAPGSIILGWALGKRVSVRVWITRSLTLVPVLVFLFAWPVVDWLGEILLKTNSGILFPNAELGIYSGELGKHLSRTVYTNTQNFAVVVWWVVALLVAAWQRDKTTVITGLIIGGGFGIGFMQSAIWVLGYGSAPGYIDWWKMWELNSGFNLGVIYAITFYWAVRNFDKSQSLNSDSANKKVERTKSTEWRNTLFMAFAGCVLIFFIGFEYFFWTCLVLCIFYFIAICFTTVGNLDSYVITERRKNILLIYSAFLLVFLMFHGGSERLGIIFELYALDEVTQYSWPLNRIILFLPAAIVITGVAIFRMWKVLRPVTPQNHSGFISSKQSMLIVDLMTVMGFIGVLSIWPAKISVFYALFLVFAIYAFNRLESRFNTIK